MEVIRGLINIKERHKGAVITVGNFDGVHTGHRTILLEMKRKAAALQTKTLLICFNMSATRLLSATFWYASMLSPTWVMKVWPNLLRESNSMWV